MGSYIHGPDRGGILNVAGIDGFLANRTAWMRMRATDATIRELVEEWNVMARSLSALETTPVDVAKI